LDLQVKLLSVLQTRTVTKIGSNKRIDLDVRIICATNAPANELVKREVLRQDLFYRINTVEIHLPPLRDRKEDIPLLVKHYLEIFCKRYHKSLEIKDYVIEQLSKYHWPGNIRELQHAIERAVILCTEPELTSKNFQLHTKHEFYERENESLNLSQVEKDVIRQALKKCNGNLTKASEELGIGRTTLYRKMEEYGLS
jgi:DNA-binding NtrC family response regulator